MAEKVFLDTNPIIYILDCEQQFYEKTMAAISAYIGRSAEFYTSTVTDAEFLVVPFRKNDQSVQDAYWNLMKHLNITRIPIGSAIAETAARLSAKYDGVKLGDALQLAASIDCGCDEFFTNDKRLKQVTEANIVYLGDL